MSYLIFRGVSTESLDNVYVSQMPSHKKAAMRFTEYYVKGRDGALHVDEGYENYDITVKLVLVNAAADSRYIVNAWADGTGKLVTSDDPTRAYQASVKSDITWQRVKAFSVVSEFDSSVSYNVGDIVQYGGYIYKFTSSHSGTWDASDVTVIPVPNGFFDSATIVFNCQPFMVEAVDSLITLTGSGSFVNPGSAISYPLIKVTGSGNISFYLQNEIFIDGMSANSPVYIDCANGYVYTAQGTGAIRGDIPWLNMGTNNVYFGEGSAAPTSIEITPHWRWI